MHGVLQLEPLQFRSALSLSISVVCPQSGTAPQLGIAIALFSPVAPLSPAPGLYFFGLSLGYAGIWEANSIVEITE
jgi:hypothetical protein